MLTDCFTAPCRGRFRFRRHHTLRAKPVPLALSNEETR